MPMSTEPQAPPKPEPSVIQSVYTQAMDFFRAMRCGHSTKPEAAEEWARLEADFEKKRQEAAGR